VSTQGSLWPDLIHPHFVGTLEDRFRAFHAANPSVYRRLLVLSRGLVDQGRTRIGIGMLFEVMRWEQMLYTTGEPWKLNNSFRSRYARLLMAQEPELAGVFETRVLHT